MCDIQDAIKSDQTNSVQSEDFRERFTTDPKHEDEADDDGGEEEEEEEEAHVVADVPLHDHLQGAGAIIMPIITITTFLCQLNIRNPFFSMICQWQTVLPSPTIDLFINYHGVASTFTQGTNQSNMIH